MARTFYFLFLFFVAFSLAPLAQAEEKTNENTAKLQTIFENYIKTQSREHSSTERQIIFDGDVIVEPSGTYYAITLPYMKIKYEDGTQMDVGMVSINAAPHTEDRQWKMSVAMPTPMTMSDESGQALMNLSIAAQRTAGIWHEDLQNFIKLDTQLNDIKIEGFEKQTYSAQIPSVQVRYDFQEDENNNWSGLATAIINKLAYKTAGGQSMTNIDQVKIDINIDQFNAQHLVEKREMLAAIEETAENDKNPPSKDHVNGLFNLILDNITNAGNGSGATYSISGLKHTRTDNQDPEIEHVLTLGSGSIKFNLDGILKDKVTLEAGVKLDKLDITPKPDEYKDITPSDLNIGFAIHNIPFKQVTELGKNTAQGAMDNPDIAKMAGLSFIMKLPMILAQSGTYLEIKDNYINGNAYKVLLDGKAKADFAAVNSATADFKTRFHGLDKVLAQTQVLAADPHNEYVDTFRSLNATLGKIKDLAKVETTADNTFIHVLNLVMNAQGQILLNGKDLFSSLGSTIMPGGAPPATSEPLAPENKGNDGVQAQ